MKLPRDGNVGSLPICHTFDEYARLALLRLRINYDDAEAARMAGLWERYGAPFERKMHCFVMLRGVLSRIIERVITLDRFQPAFGCQHPELGYLVDAEPRHAFGIRFHVSFAD